MTRIFLLYARNGARFHFGDIGVDDASSLVKTNSYIYSDTLTGALLSIAAKQDEAKFAALLESLKAGDTTISSGFPFLEMNNRRVLFMPKPVYYDLIETPEPKLIKKVSFISQKMLQEGITPDRWSEATVRFIGSRFAVLKDEIPEKVVAKNGFLEHFLEQRVMVHSDSKQDTLHQIAGLQFINIGNEVKAGFYYLVNSALPDLPEQLAAQLVHTGLGGERSSGMGQFEFSKAEQFTMPESNGDYAINLALLKAQKMENILLFKSKLRGGRPLAEGGRLKLQRMILEGAVVKGNIKGTFANLAPANALHPYWFNGNYFGFPFKHGAIVDNLLSDEHEG